MRVLWTARRSNQSIIKENEWKMGAVMNTLRLFFVGQAKGLGIADIIYFACLCACGECYWPDYEELMLLNCGVGEDP